MVRWRNLLLRWSEGYFNLEIDSKYVELLVRISRYLLDAAGQCTTIAQYATILMSD